jgi:hypothetical protein
MTYTDLLRDFSRRTLVNVRWMAERTNGLPADPPFIVTARLGALLSILALLREELPRLQREHPGALKRLANSLVELAVEVGAARGAADQVIAFRNALAHGQFEVKPDGAMQIGSVVLKDESGRWRATLEVGQLEAALVHLEEFVAALD